MAELAIGAQDELREEVRRRYAEAARSASGGCGEGGCGCGGEISAADFGASPADFGASLYGEEERQAAPLGYSCSSSDFGFIAMLYPGAVGGKYRPFIIRTGWMKCSCKWSTNSRRRDSNDALTHT